MVYRNIQTIKRLNERGRKLARTKNENERKVKQKKFMAMREGCCVFPPVLIPIGA